MATKTTGLVIDLTKIIDTFSDKAHKQFHKKYGIKNNTKEQLNKYLTN